MHNVVFTIFVTWLDAGGFKTCHTKLIHNKNGRLNACLYSVFVSDKRLKTLVFGQN